MTSSTAAEAKEVDRIADEIAAIEWTMWDGSLSGDRYWLAVERLHELRRELSREEEQECPPV
jgi:hypothetical protein